MQKYPLSFSLVKYSDTTVGAVEYHYNALQWLFAVFRQSGGIAFPIDRE